MSGEQDYLLTVEEAARRLRLAPKTVRRYLRDGALRGIKAGPATRAGRWRISESEVQRFILEGPANQLPPY